MRTIPLLLLFLLGTGIAASAQSWPISVSFLDENTALPSLRLIRAPIHPGFTIGTEYPFKHLSTGSQLGLRAELGAFFHARVENAYFTNASVFFRQPIYWDLYAEAGAGAGYMHTVYPATIWELREDGSFEEVSQAGRGHFIANLDLGLGYAIDPNWTVFIRYQAMIQTPFASTIPVLPHTLFAIGGKYFLFPEAQPRF